MKITRNNPFHQFKFLALLLAAGLILWGCDQGVPETEDMQSSASESSATLAGAVSAATANEQPGLSRKAKTTNKQLRAISRAVAKMLAEQDLRQYVYSRAMEKFDGETNVLWMQLNERTGHNLPQAMQQANGKPWASLVKSNLAPGKAQSLAPRLGDVIGRAGQLLGGPVHLYWAFAENFDADRRAPLVTFTPLGIDADEITDIMAYDASGDAHVVNGEIARKRPLIVLTANERTDKDGKLTQNALCLPGEVGPHCDPPPPPPPPCDDCGGGDDGDDGGNDGQVMRLDWIRMYDPYEGWPNGGPEFHMTLTKYDAGAEEPVSIQGVRLWDEFDIDRSDCDGDKIYLNKRVRDWNPDNFPTYSIQWVERDSNDWLYKYWIYDVPFELPSWVEDTKAIVDHFIKRDSKDDMLEHAVTNFDDSPKYYGTGAPDFKLSLVE